MRTKPQAEIGDTRAGGRGGVLLLSINIFLLMATYYVLKPVRESLILTQGGAEVKSYSAIAQVIALLFILPGYNRLAGRVRRVHLITGVMLLFSTQLWIFAALDHWHVRIAVAFFVWVGIFGVTLVTQIWAFANDLYGAAQGMRVLAVLGLAAALGTMAGSQFAIRVCGFAGAAETMILASLLLAICAAVTRAVDGYERGRSRAQAEAAARPIGGEGAFRLLRTNRHFLLIAVLVMLVNLANSTGEFMLSKLAIQHADLLAAGGAAGAVVKRQFIAVFYGQYFAWGSLVGLVLQGLLVPWVLRGLGPSRTLLIGPVVSALGYSLLALAPGLLVAEAAKIAENSLDYTLGRSALSALFLSASRAANYKVKTVIDTLFCRSGDLLQGLLVLAGTNLAFSIRYYAILNVVFAMVAAVVVVRIERGDSQSAAKVRGVWTQGARTLQSPLMAS